jgi:predicted lipoprotein with Yx(FWY)xxD motif
MKRRVLLAAPAVIALVAAGCGSNNDSSGSSASSGGGGGIYGSSSSAPAKPAMNKGPASVGVRHGPLGTFLTNSSGRTLYLFTADKGGKSACNGACAQAWPPLTTTGTPKATGGAKASLMSTIKRSDGTRQVTYGGHPLYTYVTDTAAGQTSGQGLNVFGGLWWVVGTNGKLINKS